jgi:SAM-dependent methyltransferase
MAGQEPGRLSARLAAIVDALPLGPGLRVLEIGCGPGAAARAVAARIGTGHVLAIDRSAAAVAQAAAASNEAIASGRMSVRQVAAEDFVLEPGEQPYDLAFAVRVGALDGRHPELHQGVRRAVAAALRRSRHAGVDIPAASPARRETEPQRVPADGTGRAPRRADPPGRRRPAAGARPVPGDEGHMRPG